MIVRPAREIATVRYSRFSRSRVISISERPISGDEVSSRKTTSESLPPEKSTYSEVEECPSSVITSCAAAFSG